MKKFLFVAAIGLGLTATYVQAENCENRSAPAGYHYTADCRLVRNPETPQKSCISRKAPAGYRYTADCRLIKDPSTPPNWYRGGRGSQQ